MVGALAGMIGLGLWLIIAVGAVWMLVTGRKIVFGLPRDYREGWPVRVFGLAEVLLGLVLGIGGYLASRGGAPPGSAAYLYAPLGFAAVLVVLAIWGRRPKSRPTGVSPPS